MQRTSPSPVAHGRFWLSRVCVPQAAREIARKERQTERLQLAQQFMDSLEDKRIQDLAAAIQQAVEAGASAEPIAGSASSIRSVRSGAPSADDTAAEAGLPKSDAAPVDAPAADASPPAHPTLNEPLETLVTSDNVASSDPVPDSVPA